MEYVVSSILIGVIAYLFFVRRATNRFNKLCLLRFHAWLNVYKSSEHPDRTGISRAFLLQTLHLAEKFGVLNKPDRNTLEIEMRSEDPSKIIDGWLEAALPHVIQVGGTSVVSDISAREVGLYMLICVMGINPERDLRGFLERLGG